MTQWIGVRLGVVFGSLEGKRLCLCLCSRHPFNMIYHISTDHVKDLQRKTEFPYHQHGDTRTRRDVGTTFRLIQQWDLVVMFWGAVEHRLDGPP